MCTPSPSGNLVSEVKSDACVVLSKYLQIHLTMALNSKVFTFLFPIKVVIRGGLFLEELRTLIGRAISDSRSTREYSRILRRAICDTKSTIGYFKGLRRASSDPRCNPKSTLEYLGEPSVTKYLPKSTLDNLGEPSVI